MNPCTTIFQPGIAEFSVRVRTRMFVSGKLLDVGCQVSAVMASNPGLREVHWCSFKAN
ncbi:hypothetical protein V2O64_25255 (plasmid) [Verrucomicrobiaceae bacterium 227]